MGLKWMYQLHKHIGLLIIKTFNSIKLLHSWENQIFKVKSTANLGSNFPKINNVYLAHKSNLPQLIIIEKTVSKRKKVVIKM